MYRDPNFRLSLLPTHFQTELSIHQPTMCHCNPHVVGQPLTLGTEQRRAFFTSRKYGWDPIGASSPGGSCIRNRNTIPARRRYKNGVITRAGQGGAERQIPVNSYFPRYVERTNASTTVGWGEVGLCEVGRGKVGWGRARLGGLMEQRATHCDLKQLVWLCSVYARPWSPPAAAALPAV